MRAPQIDEVRRAQRLSVIVGGLAIAASLVGLYFDRPAFARAYLLGYLFWLGWASGALVLMLLHYVAGGAWSAVLLRPAQAAARTLPALAIGFLPILIGARSLYPWAQPERAGDPLMLHRAPYLNLPFFAARTVVYFAVWIALAQVAGRWSLAIDEEPDPARYQRLRQLSAGGLVLVGLTGSFAAIDWLMTIEPEWYSSVFGALLAMAAVLTAYAGLVAVVAWLNRWPPMAAVLKPELWNDLGNLLLTLVLLWAYLAFSQYLITWSGNTRVEGPWLLRHQAGGWQWVGVAMVVLCFLLPFLVLLSRGLKRNRRRLGWVAAVVLVARLADLYWTVGPAYYGDMRAWLWLPLALWIGLGGLWLALFLWQLARHPLLPRLDRRLQPLPPEWEQAHAR